MSPEAYTKGGWPVLLSKPGRRIRNEEARLARPVGNTAFKVISRNYCIGMLKAKEKGWRSSIVCLSKEKENYGLIYERERRKTQCRLPKPEPNAEYQCRAVLLAMGPGEADRGKRGRWGQARLVGAGETDGGRRGWWGQARPMGAVSRRAKSIVNKVWSQDISQKTSPTAYPETSYALYYSTMFCTHL